MTNEELRNLKIDDLVEVTEAQIFDEPKEMVVCDFEIDCKAIRKVCAIIPYLSDGVICSNTQVYKRAFLIPEPKIRPMTALEVMKYCFDMEREEGVQIVFKHKESNCWCCASNFYSNNVVRSKKFGINHGTHVEEFKLGYVPESGYAGLKSVISHEVRE